MKKDNSLANNPTMDDDYLFASSATDCTGLIPSVAHDDYEAENYENLYPYLPPVTPMPYIGIPPVTPVPEVGLRTTTPEVGIPSTISEVGDSSAIFETKISL